MALVIQEEVVQLQVPVCDAALVEVKRKADLGAVESGVLLGQPALPLPIAFRQLHLALDDAEVPLLKHPLHQFTTPGLSTDR